MPESSRRGASTPSRGSRGRRWRRRRRRRWRRRWRGHHEPRRCASLASYTYLGIESRFHGLHNSRVATPRRGDGNESRERARARREYFRLRGSGGGSTKEARGYKKVPLGVDGPRDSPCHIIELIPLSLSLSPRVAGGRLKMVDDSRPSPKITFLRIKLFIAMFNSVDASPSASSS
jgi:hypothetical protein